MMFSIADLALRVLVTLHSLRINSFNHGKVRDSHEVAINPTETENLTTQKSDPVFWNFGTLQKNLVYR